MTNIFAGAITTFVLQYRGTTLLFTLMHDIGCKPEGSTLAISSSFDSYFFPHLSGVCHIIGLLQYDNHNIYVKLCTGNKPNDDLLSLSTVLMSIPPTIVVLHLMYFW